MSIEIYIGLTYYRELLDVGAFTLTIEHVQYKHHFHEFGTARTCSKFV